MFHTPVPRLSDLDKWNVLQIVAVDVYQKIVKKMDIEELELDIDSD